MTEAIWIAIIGAIGAVLAAGIKAYLDNRKKLSSNGKNKKLSNEVFLTNSTKEAIITIYRTVLERDPDTGGLIDYGKQLQKGEKTVREIVKEVGKSGEYFGKFILPFVPRDAVKLLYLHFLCREPESEEIIDEHVYLLEAEDWKFIVDKLVDSSEYRKRFGNHTPPRIT